MKSEFLFDLLDTAAKDWPNRRADSDGESSLTYKGLDGQSRKFAAWLAEKDSSAATV